jgi:hypothetical protein
MRSPTIRAIAQSSRLLGIAREILGNTAIPFRATLFDKSPAANWLVVWHQDTALPLRERHDLPGYRWLLETVLNWLLLNSVYRLCAPQRLR